MLNFEVTGLHKNKEWIVFLHGAGGSINTWSHQISAFEKKYNLLLIDLRDHGASKNIKPAYDAYTFQIIATDIIEVINHLGITSAHFITLSFGSVLMQQLCMSKALDIQKVVMAGGIFKGNFTIKTFVYLARIFNLFLSYPRMYAAFSYLLMPRKRNQLARRIYQIQARKLTQQEYMKWIGLYDEFFRLLKQFYTYQLEQKTMIIMGQEDYIFLRGARAFQRNQTNTTLKVIPNAGHICTIEEPDAFNALAMDFFENQ